MNEFTEKNLLNRKRAEHIGAILSNVAIAAVSAVALATLASIAGSIVSIILLVLWLGVTLATVGTIGLFIDSWFSVPGRLTGSIEFMEKLSAFADSYAVTLSVAAIVLAAISSAALFLVSGKDKSKAIGRAVANGVVLAAALVTIIKAVAG